MRHYVDGYNLLFALFEEPDGDNLQGQREECLQLIEGLAQQLKVEITVVFDARLAPVSYRNRQGAIEVAYTDEATDADDWIVEHLDYRKEQSTVVTNDRHLARRCRDLKAVVQSPAAWLRSLHKKAHHLPIPIEPQKRTFKSPKKVIEKPQIDPQDPKFLDRLSGESELDRWQRIFESEDRPNTN